MQKQLFRSTMEKTSLATLVTYFLVMIVNGIACNLTVQLLKKNFVSVKAIVCFLHFMHFNKLSQPKISFFVIFKTSNLISFNCTSVRSQVKVTISRKYCNLWA